MSVEEQLNQSLIKGFINKDVAGSVLDPKFIINKPEKNLYLLNTLQNEVSSCNEFFFSIAFVTQSGLNTIKTQLADLALKGVKGRLLTSTYLGFNRPEVFENLLNIPNLEVRISGESGFHSKGYLFQHSDYRTFVIGSSNLTMDALKNNYEWNIFLTSKENGEIISQIENHLEDEWQEAQKLDQNWIDHYRKHYQEIKIVNHEDLIKESKPEYLTDIIVPNKMQKAALSSIQKIRDEGFKEGLVISATGTGKTYLAAFDVQQVKPKKMLFIVHREQILKAAKKSFHKILGGSQSDFGILSGNSKDTDAKYLFATIQTISKDPYLKNFARDHFDYILIDEVHKAGAESYRKVIDYFKPNFLLGMTATPERSDDKNIFEMFDYHVAYEIRLKEAMEEDLLCPFNYFGVAEYVADGVVESDTKELSKFISEDRVNYIIDKINYYGADKNDPRGLVFCGNRLEAKRLAESFTRHGIDSIALTGEDSVATREEVIQKLENGEIKYIFTVDIFNEGIDVPKINQIIMLRYTQSSIIFIQQLGRGLRKDQSKEFVTVIDFIGNYKNNYLIPIALSGKKIPGKDIVRRDVMEPLAPKQIIINFEEIAKERIFKSIDSAKLNSMQVLRDAYKQAKDRLNRVPYLMDFLETNIISPEFMAFKSGASGFASYYSFLVKIKEEEGHISESDEQLLSFVSRELISGQRIHELIILEMIIAKNGVITIQDIKDRLKQENLPHSDEWISSSLATLDMSFYRGGLAKTYQDSALVRVHNQIVEPSKQLVHAMKNNYFNKLFDDVISVAFENSKEYDQSANLTRYKKYKRRDILRLLHWKEQMVDQNIGGYTYNKELKKFIIFMTVDKGDDFKGAQMAYEDMILNEQRILYFTKAKRKLTSPEVKILQNSDDWDIYIFAKKSDDEGTDFYYLGEVLADVDTVAEHQKKTKNNETQSVVSLELKLKQSIETNLYRYLTSFL